MWETADYFFSSRAIFKLDMIENQFEKILDLLKNELLKAT
jgi:hypothetical protein